MRKPDTTGLPCPALNDGVPVEPDGVFVQAHAELWLGDPQHLAVTVDVVLVLQHLLPLPHHHGGAREVDSVGLHSGRVHKVVVELSTHKHSKGAVSCVSGPQDLGRKK